MDTRSKTRGQAAVDHVNDALLLAAAGASRQVRKAQARRAHKDATRPGLHVKKHARSKDVAAILSAKPGSFGRRIRYVDPPLPPVGRPKVKYDSWVHATKGTRCQMVAA